MTVYFYDKTWAGLLTVVFDAYQQKLFPDKLLGMGEPLPLFVEATYTTVTDEEKYARVWTALLKKLSKKVCNMLLCAWLSEEEGIAEDLFRYIRKAVDAPTSIAMNFGDPDVLHIQKVARKVSHERHYLEQFLRFQKASDDIYFSPVSPRYNVLSLLIDHLKDRFSDQQWLVYDVLRHYGYYYNLHTVEEVTLDDDSHLLSGKLDESLMAEDEKTFQQLWKGYFQAITIKERMNLRLQMQHMPRRFWKYITEMQN